MRSDTTDDDVDHLLQWPSSGAPRLSLLLMPERTVYWPAQRTLFAADLHLGKAAVFRARGLPVPRGTTAATLQALSAAIERTGAGRLVVLGDFFHAKESHAPGTLAALHAWRAAHASLDALVVLGNHDRHAGTAESVIGFTVCHGPYTAPGLIGVHEAHEAHEIEQLSRTGPDDAPPLVLAGHEHPVLTLRGRLDRLRLPCFRLQGHVLTLPAFGAFTGGYEAPLHEGRRFIVGDKVTPV